MLKELSTIMAGEFKEDVSQHKGDVDIDEKGKISNRDGEMDIDECYNHGTFSENNRLVENIRKIVLDLKSLGFTSMLKDAYASVIFLLLNLNILSDIT
ncbi:Anaphase promoting complex subunit 2 [Quillaja saponaria]|uniref:Anaphase promoting complex subunit 2 n=1 Tax=Quillaja saponaria TaxID=32244 RepID=A0AAD7PNA6_QUISA|nr:Anaphase promoting complex subunit 2 [Quillaja saponaria]